MIESITLTMNFSWIYVLNNLIDCPYLLKHLNFRDNLKSTINQDNFTINNFSKSYLKLLHSNILMFIGNSMNL